MTTRATYRAIRGHIFRGLGVLRSDEEIDALCAAQGMTPEALLEWQEQHDREEAAALAFEASIDAMPDGPEKRGLLAARERQHMPCSVAEAEAMGYVAADGTWLDDPAARKRRVEQMVRERRA